MKLLTPLLLFVVWSCSSNAQKPAEQSSNVTAPPGPFSALATKLVTGLAADNSDSFTSVGITLAHMKTNLEAAVQQCPSKYGKYTEDDLQRDGIHLFGTESRVKSQKQADFAQCRSISNFEKAVVKEIVHEDLITSCGTSSVLSVVIIVEVNGQQIFIHGERLNGVDDDWRTGARIQCYTELPSSLTCTVPSSSGFASCVDFCGEKRALDTEKLSCSSAVRDLEPLAKLTNLTDVYLYNMSVTDLGPLAKLTKLELLHVGVKELADVRPLAKLSQLKELWLSDTKVSDLAPLSELKELKMLLLSETPVSDLQPLAKLSKIERLDLYRTSVSDITPLAGLTSLERLDIRWTKVLDLKPLARLTNLDRVVIDHNPQITDDQVRELRRALPTLTIDR